MWRPLSLVAVVLGTSGCSKLIGIEDFTLAADAALPDPDAEIDAPQFCYGTSLVRVCLPAPPTDPYTAVAAIDTNVACTRVQTEAVGPELCVITATTIAVNAASVVTGPRPLVLVASDTIAIATAGTIDASSRTTTRIGAGANDSSCPQATVGQNSTAGAGGGGGAGFGSIGGNGGTAAVAAGSGSPTSAPMFLRGGCKGADGGDNGATQGGLGGNGGGAVYLIAGTSITVSGNIFASASGGTGGGLRGGGGGGGSGGMIGLDAPTINAPGIIAANGGSGGGGGGTTTAGGAGGDGTTTMYTSLATAGAGGASGTVQGGGSGGRGAATNSAGGLGQNQISAGAGGGGGGGGTGVVWVKGALTGTRISPAATMAP